jgi:hypothetical protein
MNSELSVVEVGQTRAVLTFGEAVFCYSTNTLLGTLQGITPSPNFHLSRLLPYVLFSTYSLKDIQ